jgi:hypothetical protein
VDLVSSLIYTSLALYRSFHNGVFAYYHKPDAETTLTRNALLKDIPTSSHISFMPVLTAELPPKDLSEKPRSNPFHP